MEQTERTIEEFEEEKGGSFASLGLTERTLAAVAKKGFSEPTPIQALTIPRFLQENANLIARARTGTGKTAAFGLPLIEKITEKTGAVQALILAPTRELALQVKTEIESFTTDGFPRVAAVYGGAGMREQLSELRRGVEIVVGTPGRVQDHINRKSLDISNVDFFILDEADEMLDMGFIDDIEEIFSNVREGARVLLFSATMPREILRTAEKFMGGYEILDEGEQKDAPILTEQKYWVVKESEKISALVRLIDISPDFYGLVFTQRKSDADTVARALDDRGYEAVALHGDIAQNMREKILQRFRKGKTRIVVATDVAARGIDVKDLTHVVNYSLPGDCETYIHRIGRTGRAGANGLAFTFVTPSENRKAIQRFIRASKGNLHQAKIPSAEEVLAVKQKRILDETTKKLQSKFESADGENQGEAKSSSVFAELAEKLCTDYDAKEIVAAMLENNFSAILNPERYGKIAEFSADSAKSERAKFRANQTRLFIALGREDGFSKRDVSEFFADRFGISERDVDDIDLADRFCLVSLPTEVANLVLETGRSDANFPHVHIDSKPKGGHFERPRGEKRFSGRDERKRGFRRERGGFDEERPRKSKFYDGFERSKPRAFGGFRDRKNGGLKESARKSSDIY